MPDELIDLLRSAERVLAETGDTVAALPGLWRGPDPSYTVVFGSGHSAARRAAVGASSASTCADGALIDVPAFVPAERTSTCSPPALMHQPGRYLGLADVADADAQH